MNYGRCAGAYHSGFSLRLVRSRSCGRFPEEVAFPVPGHCLVRRAARDRSAPHIGVVAPMADGGTAINSGKSLIRSDRRVFAGIGAGSRKPLCHSLIRPVAQDIACPVRCARSDSGNRVRQWRYGAVLSGSLRRGEIVERDPVHLFRGEDVREPAHRSSVAAAGGARHCQCSMDVRPQLSASDIELRPIVNADQAGRRRAEADPSGCH